MAEKTRKSKLRKPSSKMAQILADNIRAFRRAKGDIGQVRTFLKGTLRKFGFA